MTLLNTHRANLARGINALLILCAVGMFSISVIMYKAPATSMLVFVLFACVYLQLPGLCLLSLLKINLKHLSSYIISGLFAGWSIVVAEYFLCDFLRNDLLLLASGPSLTLAYIIILVKKHKSGQLKYSFSLSKVPVSALLFTVLILLYALLCTQYKYMNPAVSDFTYLNADKAYHLGLINALSHDYPLISPWVQGREIRYHIFTEVVYAVALKLFDIPADTLFLSCGPFMTAYVFSMSVYCFFREFSKKADRAGIYSLLILLSNLFIVRNWRTSMAFHFAIINDNSAGYGIAGFLVFLILMKDYYENRVGIMDLRIVILIATSMLVTGIKGPMGLVLVGSLWGTYVIGLILRKVKFSEVAPIILISIGFICVYMTVLGAKGQSNGSGESIFAFATITNLAFWKAPLIELMNGFGIPSIVRLLVILFVFMVFVLTAYFVPFCLGYITEFVQILRSRKPYEMYRIVIYAAIVVGFVGMFFLNYSGHSQIYFGLVSIFLAPYVAYSYLEDLEEIKDKKKYAMRLRNIVLVVFVTTIAMTTVSLSVFYEHHFENARHSLNTHNEYGKYISISRDEYEAMQWIEENTPKDSLLATDRYYSVPLSEYSYQNRWTNRFFLYAVYANRYCYIAGSGYNLPAGDWVIRKEMIETNSKLYDPDNSGRGKLAQKLGVDYIVVSKRFSKLPSLSDKYYELCFSNDDIDIYAVSQ